MSGLLHYLQLQVKSKTGISTGVVVWALIAIVCAVATVIFIIFAIFIMLAEWYDPLVAALVMGGFFLLFAILAGIFSLMLHRRTAEQAKRALESRRGASLLDPKFLGVGLQVVRTIGLRRIVPLIGVGLLAGGLAKEWFNNDKRDEDEA